MDVHTKQKMNFEQQRFTASEAEQVHLDMMGRQIEARIQVRKKWKWIGVNKKLYVQVYCTYCSKCFQTEERERERLFTFLSYIFKMTYPLVSG